MIGSLRKAASFWKSFSRRELFQRAGAISLPALTARRSAAAPEAGSTGLRVGPEIYQSIGIRPLINCRGTLTIVGGSLILPEVRAAMDAAAQHFVQIDEMMDAIGKRLAELTGAEYGMVSSGCAAGLAHATAACVAGGNPDLHVRIPNLAGFAKDEVIIPTHSRNVYDAAIRSVGVRVIEVGTPEELERALGPRVAMIYIFAGPRADSGPLPFETITKMAKERSVPVLVDAAAEMLTVPNVHLQHGATLVAYSGGKVLRGPQSAGILLGRKDLIRAAWVHSAPHHGNGRMMKFGKEEAMGMLMAVEMWMKRDHPAEMKTWVGWMNNISARVSKVDGVSATVREARGLSNHSPGLTIRWDPSKLGITGEEVTNILYTTEPRIALAGGGGGGRSGSGNPNETGISISALMMSPGEDKIVADKIYEILTKKRPPLPPKTLASPAGDLSGRWDVRIDYAAGQGTHVLHLKQTGNQLTGTQQGEFLSREITGTVDGENVRLASNVTEAHGDALSFTFTGKLQGDSLTGTLSMGEYLGATWSATRHSFERSRGADD